MSRLSSIAVSRRTFGALCAAGAVSALGLTGCSTADSAAPQAAAPDANPLPAASPDPESPFAVDTSVNVGTIDGFLGRGDTVYRDMRLVKDPANYADIGGSSNLETTIEGFRIVAFPYVGTLAPLPVSGAYDGDRLFDIEWGEGIEILSATPRYEQSEQILEEVFPKDKNIVLMCGGGGYAGMMQALLIHLGWDASKIYNIGGMWDYAGDNVIELVYYDDGGEPHFYLWRADMTPIEFDQLDAIAS